MASLDSSKDKAAPAHDTKLRDTFKGHVKGSIELITGPMFSGKTTELIRRYTRCVRVNLKCMVIKYTNDDRYSNTHIVTHDNNLSVDPKEDEIKTNNNIDSCSGKTELPPSFSLHSTTPARLAGSVSGNSAGCIPANIVCRELSTISNSMIAAVDIVFIDEGHFFTDLARFCTNVAFLHKKKCIISALNGNYDQRPFTPISDLFPLVTSITKLSAICSICQHEDADYSCLKDNRDYPKRESYSDEIIGGADIYYVACSKCLLKKVT